MIRAMSCQAAEPRGGRPSVRPRLALVLWLVALAPRDSRSQSSRDPHVPMPERPSIATHAWTVAPGFLELESGAEWDANPDHSSSFTAVGYLKLGLTHCAQLGVQSTLIRPPGTPFGPGDLSIALKYRLADDLPVLGALALLPGIKLPTADRLHGTTTTDVSLLLVSSQRLGVVSLDVNVGYTRRSGDGLLAPRNATVWTVSTGFPVAGVLGLAAEVFGYPETTGPAGAPSTVAVLAGPTFALLRRAVFDIGGILHLRGPQPNALYAGVAYNLGSF